MPDKTVSLLRQADVLHGQGKSMAGHGLPPKSRLTL